MITFVEGIIEHSLPNQVVINVGGIGYLIFIPLSSYHSFSTIGEKVRILTQHIVREDAELLYGFSTMLEKDLFSLLTANVSGIGPKLALAILSGISVEEFKHAVINSDITRLSAISGVGKKTAERIILELKDKLGVAAEWLAISKKDIGDQSNTHDAILAMLTLGYKTLEAQKAIQKVVSQIPYPISTEEIVKRALEHIIS